MTWRACCGSAQISLSSSYPHISQVFAESLHCHSQILLLCPSISVEHFFACICICAFVCVFLYICVRHAFILVFATQLPIVVVCRISAAAHVSPWKLCVTTVAWKGEGTGVNAAITFIAISFIFVVAGFSVPVIRFNFVCSSLLCFSFASHLPFVALSIAVLRLSWAANECIWRNAASGTAAVASAIVSITKICCNSNWRCGSVIVCVTICMWICMYMCVSVYSCYIMRSLF